MNWFNSFTSTSNLSDIIDNIGINIISNVVWLLLVLVFVLCRNWIQRQLAAIGATPLTRIMLYFAVLSLIMFIVLNNTTKFVLSNILFLAFSFLSNQEILRFSRIGITDAHLTTVGGVDYKQALIMATNSMDFLGIGGDKITLENEFQRAMIRCASGNQKVRFLLSPPDNPLLEKVARLNNTTAGSYGEKVRQSVTRIAQLRKERSLDIEVRYYAAKHDRTTNSSG